MKTKLGFVLAAALLIELLNFFFCGFPIDVGYPPDTPWYVDILGSQWVLFHLIGLKCLDWFEKASGCHLTNVPGGCSHVDAVILFAGGFLTTAAVVLVLTYLVHLILKAKSKRDDLPATDSSTF